MKAKKELQLSSGVAEQVSLLEQNLLDTQTAENLRARLATEPVSPPAVGAALVEVCGALHGGDAWKETPHSGRIPLPLDKTLHESLVVHPREKQERRHQLASLLGRVLQLLEGNAQAQTIARVTERAQSDAYPRTLRLTGQCADVLQMEPPDIHIARGEEWFCMVLQDKKPYLCIHHNWIESASFAPETPLLTDAEARFALGHNLEHIKKGHAAFLQISPQKLEALVLDQVPFLFRTPIQLASKAIGWTRANRAVKKVSEWLPEESAGQRIAETVGELLPDQNQQTVLPEVVHEWVRRWIQGVEFSADRAGLISSGSVAASCAAMLRLSPDLSPQFPTLKKVGARQLLLKKADEDRETSARLQELLRFALSSEYLTFLAQNSK